MRVYCASMHDVVYDMVHGSDGMVYGTAGVVFDNLCVGNKIV